MVPEISVIINFYNCEEYISSAVDSVINQTFKNIEIILVDDGSSDNSLNIVQKYAETDKRIRIYKKEHNGLCASRNYGIEKAAGKYIMFLDADDWLEYDACEKLVTCLGQNKKVDIVFFNFRFLLDKVVRVNKIPDNIAEDKIFKFTGVYNKILYFENVVWNKIYKSDFLKNNKITFKPQFNMHEDLLFTIELFAHNPNIMFCRNVLYNYRLRNNSASRIPSTEMFFILEQMYEYTIKQKYYKYKYNFFIDNLFLKSCYFIYRYYYSEKNKLFLISKINKFLLSVKKQKNLNLLNSLMYRKLFFIVVCSNFQEILKNKLYKL